MSSHSEEFELTPQNTTRLSNLCGPMNSHLRELERHFGVRINNRGYMFMITGKETVMATQCVKDLYEKAGQDITLSDIHAKLQYRNLQEKIDRRNVVHDKPSESDVMIHTPLQTIKPRGSNQAKYVSNIERFTLTFGVGPAGTGKTYLAVAKGVELLEKEIVKRLVLVRPAVEAGEQLGFLPGDMIQKVDPYLRPMYDALYTMLRFDRIQRLIDNGTIEVAPLAYMRGRSLNDAFIILDEAQNTTIQQMKMLLTRIGSGAKVVVTGDLTQADLPRNQLSGLKHAINILESIDDIAFSFFDNDDVIRHPLLRKIISAYDKSERNKE